MGSKSMGESPEVPSRRPVTSIDVAAESGFSQATVARVFSSPHLVSESTRRKVEEAAVHLGYVPNAIARSLKSQRTDIIGAIFPSHGEYWQHVLTSFSRHLAASQKQLLLFSFADTSEVDQVLASLQQYRVDGLIVASASVSQSHLSRVDVDRVPVIAFNQPAASGVLPSVSVDNAEGSAELARHLIEQGVRSVTFVGGTESASTDQMRYRGAARALGAAGIGCAYVEAGSFAYADGYKIAGALADQDLPDAFMVSGDELAFGVLDGLEQHGIEAPNDVLLTGFDGLPQASWAGYDLTTLVQNVDQLVDEAIEVLLDQKTTTDAPIEVVVPGSLRLGRTTGRSING